MWFLVPCFGVYMSIFRVGLLAVCLCFVASATRMVSAEEPMKMVGYKPSEPVLAMFKEGDKKWKEKDFAGCERAMSETIKADPKFPRAYYLRAMSRHMLHDYDGALSDCDQAIAVQPNANPIFYFERAVTEYRLKKLDECIRDCNVAIKRAPKFPGTYLYRSNARFDKGDRKGAWEDCEAYLKANPLNVEALKLKARFSSGG